MYPSHSWADSCQIVSTNDTEELQTELASFGDFLAKQTEHAVTNDPWLLHLQSLSRHFNSFYNNKDDKENQKLYDAVEHESRTLKTIHEKLNNGEPTENIS
jgi:hypothetical protein